MPLESSSHLSSRNAMSVSYSGQVGPLVFDPQTQRCLQVNMHSNGLLEITVYMPVIFVYWLFACDNNSWNFLWKKWKTPPGQRRFHVCSSASFAHWLRALHKVRESKGRELHRAQDMVHCFGRPTKLWATDLAELKQTKVKIKSTFDEVGTQIVMGNWPTGNARAWMRLKHGNLQRKRNYDNLNFRNQCASLFNHVPPKTLLSCWCFWQVEGVQNVQTVQTVVFMPLDTQAASGPSFPGTQRLLFLISLRVTQKQISGISPQQAAPGSNLR